MRSTSTSGERLDDFQRRFRRWRVGALIGYLVLMIAVAAAFWMVRAQSDAVCANRQEARAAMINLSGRIARALPDALIRANPDMPAAEREDLLRRGEIYVGVVRGYADDLLPEVRC